MELLKHLHSGLRWLVLLFAVLAVLKALMGLMSKSKYSVLDNKLSLYLVSVCDFQLLIGLVLYFLGPLGYKNIQNMGMGEVMRNSYSRFFAIEHIIGMLIAIFLFHVGRVKTKKVMSDVAKHKATFIYVLIGLIIILATIPWPFKAGFEGIGWF